MRSEAVVKKSGKELGIVMWSYHNGFGGIRNEGLPLKIIFLVLY